MKKYLIIALIAFASCKKETATNNLVTDNPSVTSVKFYKVLEAGAYHPMFDVTIISDTNTVAKIELYVGYMTLRWEVYNPKNGTYRMYDHIGEFPTYTQSVYYHFQFVKKDGTKIKLPDFQVY